MKLIIVAFVALVASGCSGCSSPCERTARHAMAMGRACIEIGDPAIRSACEKAYESVGDALAAGKCSTEVTR